MTNNYKTIGLVLGGIVIGLIISSIGGSNALGGVYNNVKNYFAEGISVGSSSQFTVSSAGALTTSGTVTMSGATTLSGDPTISGGTLNVTTSNTATSTIIGGCFQFYATSTATALNFTASTTPGIMYSSYGACPNL